MTKVLFEKKGHIAIVTLNRPEARNAFDPELLIRLGDAWEQVKTDNDIRVAIVTGSGDKAFCAGADLGRLIPLMSGAREPEDEWDNRAKAEPGALSKGILRDWDIEKPVIAAINGHAIAGGMELVQGTDIRVSADTARFGVQEVKWAIFPAGGSTVRLPRQLPYAKAMELLLTGDLISAQEALELGFLNRVVPKGQELGAAMEIAEKIAANGPIAVKAIRQSARACLGLTEEEGMKLENKISGPVFRTQDAQEGPRAFMEKRAPAYQGK